MHFKRTRIAPTPSGFLHLGNLFSFGLTAALAKKTGAKLFLRIDDLDRERLDDRYVEDMFDTLNFMQIPWQEGPLNSQDYKERFSQIHRLDIYEAALATLVKNGQVYACTCSRADVLRNSADGSYPGTCRERHIPLDTENACWRLYTPKDRKIAVKTENGVTRTTLPKEMHDFIVRKKDGFPAYQLSSLMDDGYFEVDLIVRGMDLWPSTLAQLYLASLLNMVNFTKTTFYHHALLMDTEHNKLSKSAGATSIRYLRQQHKNAAAIYALMGQHLGLEITVKNWEDLGYLVSAD